MQITANTTAMEAGLAVATDKEGHDHCVVVVKGTFHACPDGQLKLAEEQQPLVYADEHYGDPETTCIRHECDFAPDKPFAEVIVVGQAVPPHGRAVSKTMVRLQVGNRNKDVAVFGDRQWYVRAGFVEATPPAPFEHMPLTFDRSFGGADDTRGEDKVAVEHRNLHGVGFNPHRPDHQLEGRSLPNLEHPRQLLRGPRDKPDPIGLGVLGRGFKQRVDFAGTYDKHWLDEVCPFLPADFDTRYFMSAPQDQWFPLFRGGERIGCTNMAEQPVVQYVLPKLPMPVVAQFADRQVECAGKLDTVIVEPHEGRAMLCWRASVRLGKKLNQLREVRVGEQKARASGGGFLGYRDGKPRFRGLGAAVAWLRGRRMGK